MVPSLGRYFLRWINVKNKFVVIDLETTGNAPKKGDNIIQIAAVVIEEGKITEKYDSFVQPGIHIPIFIKELTGITDEMVKHAPNFSQIAPTIMSLLDGAYFIAHNVQFDLSFLNNELVHAGYEEFTGPVIDTVEMARIVYPTADGYQLNELASMIGFDHDRPHQADSDALVTAQLFLQMVEKLNSLPEQTLQSLFALSTCLKSSLHLLLEQIIVKKQTTIQPLPQHLEIFNGIALRKDEAFEKERDTNNKWNDYPLADDEKEALLQSSMHSFERRSGQYTMMDEVYGAFLQSRHSLIEAGTGVGKSLAYLIPAAYFAKQANDCVVISTYTTLLQEQLLTKEIPLLDRMLPFSVQTVLLKGRTHYISLEKFSSAIKERNDNYDATLTKMQILIWLTETQTGDVDELNLSSGGALFWNKIKNDEMMFFKNKQWLARDFYLRARNKARSADLIITNHALLIADVAAKRAILPSYQYVIIDEAHQFARAASKQIGYRLDFMSIRWLLGKIGTLEQKQLFYHLEKVIAQECKQKETEHTTNANTINEKIHELTYEIDQFFGTVQTYVTKQIHPKQKASNRLSVRFIGDKKSVVVLAAERYYFSLKELIVSLRERVASIQQTEAKLTSLQRFHLEEIATILDEMEQIQQIIKQLFLTKSSTYVIWIEMDKRSIHQTISIIGEPVVVSPLLQKQFFNNKKSAVLTSATLTVNQSFQYMIDELGLNKFQPNIVQVDSPFQYEKQVQLIIPDDLPEINQVTEEDYIAAMTEYIISVAEATKGRMLILFTSYDMLKNTYNMLKESGMLEDFMMIAQGITSGSRTRLTKSFQRFDRAILLGTSSFWEGVDIPGEDLSCLMIVRLPFSAPDEPVFEAKSSLLIEQGKNPFTQLSLPEAVLRFKQGFGRLIRTEKDQGVIIVLDRRIVTKSYGKVFLQSIPSIPVKLKKIDETVDFIQQWLK